MMQCNPNESESTPQRISFADGCWLPHDKISINVEDTGIRQGVVAVERLRTYHQQLFSIDRHLDRWQRTTETLAIEGLPPRAEIAGLMSELLERNSEWVRSQGDVGITMLATPGIAASNATLLLHLNPLHHEQIEQRQHLGQPLFITPVVQPDSLSWPRGIKTRARIHYYLADRHARSQDPDSVGVLLDQDGSITETSIANLAIVKSGQILSPPTDRVLGGITQTIVETVAERLSLPWQKQPISPDELTSADEVLLMGTDGGVWFANSVDGTPISDGKPGQILLQLQAELDALVKASQSAK